MRNYPEQSATTTTLGNEDQRKVERKIMKINDEVAQNHIDTLEADNLALRVQVQLLEEENVSLKVWMQQKFANADFQVA